MHLQRHQAGEDYIEVKDSASYVKFGRKFLVKPGDRSGIEYRTFYDLEDSDIKLRSQEVTGVKTLTGINSVFQYIVFPSGKVMFRKFPCFCPNCYKMDFLNCSQTDIVGKVRTVVEAGEDIRKNN